MDNSNLNADKKSQSQELDQLEVEAEEAGRIVMGNPLDQGREMSEDAQITVASALAQLYIQRYIKHLDARDITLHPTCCFIYVAS